MTKYGANRAFFQGQYVNRDEFRIRCIEALPFHYPALADRLMHGGATPHDANLLGKLALTNRQMQYSVGVHLMKHMRTGSPAQKYGMRIVNAAMDQIFSRNSHFAEDIVDETAAFLKDNRAALRQFTDYVNTWEQTLTFIAHARRGDNGRYDGDRPAGYLGSPDDPDF